MAEALFLVSRSQAVGKRTVNGVQAVLINADDGGSTATICAAAASQCNVAYAGTNSTLPFDPEYFDTAFGLGDLSTGALKDNHDAYVFANDAPPVKVEG